MNLNEIKTKMLEELNKAENIKELNDLKVSYQGKKGIITELMSKMKDLNPEERKTFGMEVNDVRNSFNEIYETKLKEINEKELNEKLEKDAIDITLPATKIKTGSPNILEKVVEEVEELMMSMGYDVVDGPEIEEDHYNFELLNIPKGHPARDAQDTFYLEDEKILLRSQTSPVQARVMLEGKGEKPIRVICPGKTYRRDDDDATHSHQFMQIEGLLVDKDALILQSSKDQVVPIENGIEIFDNIKSTNKCLTYIENGRHAVFEGNGIEDERKKEIAEYIRLFLRGGRKWKMIKNDKI